MAYDGYECLRFRVERNVAFVTIDHPPINLFDAALMRDLARAGAELEADPAVRVVVFRSADPDFFIAHADVGRPADLCLAVNEVPGGSIRPSEYGPCGTWKCAGMADTPPDCDAGAGGYEATYGCDCGGTLPGADGGTDEGGGTA